LLSRTNGAWQLGIRNLSDRNEWNQRRANRLITVAFAVGK
jgi:hypothetical protein